LVYSQIFAPEALRILAGGEPPGVVANTRPSPRRGDRSCLVCGPSGAGTGIERGSGGESTG